MIKSIPKIIHYIWMGDQSKLEKYSQNIETWKIKNPDYNLILWDETQFLKYDNAKFYIDRGYFSQASDLMRFSILKDHGGWYLDTDVICHKSLNDFLNKEFVIGYSAFNFINFTIIGAVPNNEYITELFNCFNKYTIPTERLEIELNYKNKKYIIPNSSDFIGTKFLEIYDPNFKAYPEDYFLNNDGNKQITHNTYCEHILEKIEIFDKIDISQLQKSNMTLRDIKEYYMKMG